MILDIPEAEYHATEALSASGAWTLANECPALYWHRSPFNPNAAPAETSKPMDIGTAVHLAALEPDRLIERTALVEADDWRSKNARDLRDEYYAMGLVPLLTKDAILVDRLASAIRDNKHARELLDGARTEVSYFWEADGIPCKARADILCKSGGQMADLKSSASASPDFFRRQAFNQGHFLRAPWYQDGFLEASGTRISDYWFIVVGTSEPHLTMTCKLDERALEWGRLQIRRALTLFRECQRKGEWPGYCDGPVTLGLPDWAEYRLADAEQEGRFDPRRITGADAQRGNQYLAPVREKE